MGTDEHCMAWVHDEIGRACGLPRALGGIPLDVIGATGWGLFHAIQVALKRLEMSLEGARVVVQGFGAVGSHAARFLTGAGAVLVGACDIEGAVYCPDGLNVERLLALQAEGLSISHYQEKGVRHLERDAVTGLPCEIWIPAARPDVVTLDNVHGMDTRIVAQGANIPCTPEAERVLHERGVLVLPDFIANAGGVICASVECAGGSEAEALEQIATKIRDNTEAVLEMARGQGIPPREAAEILARKRLREAMGYGRFTGNAA